MNLAASLVVRNELARYLEPCIAHLREFCDRIVVLDDGSDDETETWLHDQADGQLIVERQDASTFYAHEGRTRQLLIDVTLEQRPDFVFSLDADEFASDGTALRARIEAEPEVRVWSLAVEEVWRAEDNYLYVREDGGWRTHPLPVLWKAPPHGSRWTVRDRKLACGRVPEQVWQQGGRAKASGEQVLHFGWADPSTRQARYDRYATHDGGRFHASRHLQSILWDDRRVKLRQRQWPEGPVFDGLRERCAAVSA